MKILITGITGFVGSHLAEYCLTKPNTEVFGTARPADFKSEMKNIKDIKGKIKIFQCDTTDKKRVAAIIKKIMPDKIFHLAAQNFVPLSWKFPEDTLFNNISSEINIFEAVKAININPKIIIACSSGEYGMVYKNELPIKETNHLRPLTPYALSKVAQEMLALQYFRSYGLKTILTRFFTIEGPRRRQEFGISNFAKQIADIENGDQEPVISVGNLAAENDFIDVRDAVRAYWLASEKCKFGEPYNVCSGKAKSMKWVLDTLISLSKVKNIQVKIDPKRMRPLDVPVVLGDYSKFKKQTKWEAKVDFKTTLADILDYWRQATSKKVV